MGHSARQVTHLNPFDPEQQGSGGDSTNQHTERRSVAPLTIQVRAPRTMSVAEGREPMRRLEHMVQNEPTEPAAEESTDNLCRCTAIGIPHIWTDGLCAGAR